MFPKQINWCPAIILNGNESCCLSECNDRLGECMASKHIKDTPEVEVGVVCLGELNLLLH